MATESREKSEVRNESGMKGKGRICARQLMMIDWLMRGVGQGANGTITGVSRDYNRLVGLATTYDEGVKLQTVG